MLRRPAVNGPVVTLLLLAGCGSGADDVPGGAAPHASLAQEAVLAAMNQVALGRVSGHTSSGGMTAATVDPGQGPAGSGETLLVVEDERGDHGDGPRYADLADVAVADSDEGLAVSLRFAEVVPGRLARGEMQDVAVEVFRTSPVDMLTRQDGPDFRLELDGGARGWRAFLLTEHGYVDFPGTFTVNGRALEVVLPWESVGGRERAEIDAFADWSSGVARLATDAIPRGRIRPG